jgi:hypothetical protein
MFKAQIMTTKDQDFSSAIHRQSNMVITEEILLSVHKYKLGLIDAMLYPQKDKHQEPQTSRQKAATPNRKTDKVKTDTLLVEIKRVEAWLKKHWNIWINDNNRKLTA